MKCPWRPVQTTTHFPTTKGEVVVTDFQNCYKEECPFYSPERHVTEHLISPEHCKRTKQKEAQP